MTRFGKNRPALTEPELSRRSCLKLGGLAMATSLVPRLVFAHSRHFVAPEKSLAFYNMRTGESLRTVYCLQGDYLPEALADINYILRDYRADEIKPIDPRLLDLLYAIGKKLEARQPFHVISGYRSPATNARLRRHRKGVAKHSLHIQGKAVDICLPSYDLAAVRRAAVAVRGGGVGYYPRSNFVHVDTGRVRYW